MFYRTSLPNLSPHLAVPVALLLAACMPVAAPPPTGPPDPARLHSFTVDRAFTLTDPRELDFRDQIAAQARVFCGFGDYSLYSARPVGHEVVAEDFIYRQHDVQITCDS
ncbi:MAG: hypothetical protein Q7J44_18300 [Pseudotabrizicola sp.]|uniref:hypothetical protein n=1 Tax=Pseudotabrizicola sp. TaxID=2939647 RepID=UPI002721048B|nr:hypothetical protein [Pseudotabrizicola sp.]MDO9640490.1 hypothetical protein [Pseudotabrizicola sp.]